MTYLSDERLWRRAQGGDGQSFALLFDRYADAVYNYCFRRTADWSLAQDLVSAVFLDAWRKRADVELTSESRRLLPWLLGVANNKIRAEHRRRRRLARALLRIGRHEDEAFDEETLGRIEDQRRMAAINAAVAALPPHELDVLVLFAWADLAYAEIAQVLEIPIGTVRSRLARARERLRELELQIGHEADDTTPRKAARDEALLDNPS
jgi:RNA polymerase sigma-70 factor, ECF subfamily